MKTRGNQFVLQWEALVNILPHSATRKRQDLCADLALQKPSAVLAPVLL